MFSCNEVSKKVSESLDQILPIHHRMLILMHLMMCKYCWRFRKQLKTLRKLSRLAELPDDFSDSAFALPAEARARIKNAVTAALR